MQFSIVTPSFRHSQWLRLCIASVADQEGVEVEHIVQDACSDDGTHEWLPHDQRVRAFIEKDKGMYDAINRGYRRARGDILAHLNCDEQYLPGKLRDVHNFFQQNPNVEVVFAGTIVVDAAGRYVCHRPPLLPNPHHIWFRLPVQTSALFIRRSVIHDRGICFDTRWRDFGDLHWVMELVKRNVPMAVLNSFTSTFSDTGENMNLKPNAIEEEKQTLAMAPKWVRSLRPALIWQHRLRRLFAGHYFLKATKYAIYTMQSPDARFEFDANKPTAIWWSRYSSLARSLALGG
jgi:glycosyltransferase involved in cell wall biosynthesis